MPKEEEVVRGPKRKLPPRIACATLVVIEAYLEGKRKPLPYSSCVQLVKPFGTQPNLVLHQIERAGFFLGDTSRAKNRDRIVNCDLGLEAKVEGVLVRFWPDPEPAARRAIKELFSHADRRAHTRTSKPPPISRSHTPAPTADEVLRLAREHFGAGEFTIPQLRDAARLTLKAFDRMNALLKDGKVVQVGGTGHKRNPRRFQVAGMEEVAIPTTPVNSTMLKSREELEAEVAFLTVEIERFQSQMSGWDGEMARLDALVVDHERELEAVRAQRDAHRLSKSAVDLDQLLEHRNGLRALVENYALLQKTKQ